MVHILHINLIQPTYDLDMIFTEKFCVVAAPAIKLQYTFEVCNFQYGFDDHRELPATIIVNLNEEELEGSPNNIPRIINQQTCLS